MTFLGLKMIIFGHFSRFLASFKISFSSLQHPNHDQGCQDGFSFDELCVMLIYLKYLATVDAYVILIMFNEKFD